MKKTFASLGVSQSLLEDMAEKLRVYDVEQGAWEHEQKGFEFNEHHILTHFVKNYATKHFTYSGTVERDIAPDSLQYALRLMRWTNQSNAKLLGTTRNLWDGEMTTNRFTETAKAAYLESMKIIAANAHDHDHQITRETAVAEEDQTALRAGGLLLYSAGLQGGAFGFDLAEAFNGRLSDLRARFNIAEPGQ